MQIQPYNTNENPLFLAKDIGILMDISNIYALCKKYESNERVIGQYSLPDGRIKETIFLTRYGVYRAMFNTRSRLGIIFRNFIYKLIDHCVLHENQKLRLMVEDLQKTTGDDYRNLYEIAQQERINLFVRAEEEYDNRRQIEDEKIAIEIENQYHSMHIEDLKAERDKYRESLIHFKCELPCMLNHDMDTIMDEMTILRRRFLKPVYIYIARPEYLEYIASKPIVKSKRIKKGKKDTGDNKEEIIEFSDDDSKEISAEQELKVYNFENEINSNFLSNYKKNFNMNIAPIRACVDNTRAIINCLDDREVLYYVALFNKPPADAPFFINNEKVSSPALLYIATEYIVDKAAFSELLTSLKNTTTNYPLSKDLWAFKTSYEDIKSLIYESIRHLI